MESAVDIVSDERGNDVVDERRTPDVTSYTLNELLAAQDFSPLAMAKEAVCV